MIIHQKQGFCYTPETHIHQKTTRKKICGMLGCSEVGEGQGHGCWVSLWSVGLVGSCRQSPMEYLVEPVCLAHGIVLCFVLGHLMCCLFSGPWYISVFSRIGQIPRRDSQGFLCSLHRGYASGSFIILVKQQASTPHLTSVAPEVQALRL